MFDGVKPEWTDKVRHLGNVIDTTCTDYIDCITKKSYFIGYVNKLKVNFGKMIHNILINLFKSYFSSFYSSRIWKFISHGCKSWNITICTLLQLSFYAHTCPLGSITENIIFELNCTYVIIVFYIMLVAMLIIIFIDLFCIMKHVISKITENELTHDQLALNNNLTYYSILDQAILI